jgi:sec-independent protein translocase protein TatB
MFGIGTSEVLLILLIVLIVLGPKEIPKVARTLGRAMREFQRITDELKQTLNAEIDNEEETRIKPRESKAEEKKYLTEDNKSSIPEGETKKETLS